jgi:hypothetical protein
MKYLKLFEDYSDHEDDDFIKIDLIRIFPQFFSREARIKNLSQAEKRNYSRSITTTLTAERKPQEDDDWDEDSTGTSLSQAEINQLGHLGLGIEMLSPEELDDYDHLDNIDNSWYDPALPAKAKITFFDEEADGDSPYGPYGGAHQSSVWCGMHDWSEEAVLKKYNELDAQSLFV